MNNIIEIYALAIIDKYNDEWSLDRVPPQIRKEVENKVEELKDNEGGEKE